MKNIYKRNNSEKCKKILRKGCVVKSEKNIEGTSLPSGLKSPLYMNNRYESNDLMEQLRYAVVQYLVDGVNVMPARYDTLVQIAVGEVVTVLEGIREKLHGIDLRR